MFDEKSSKPKKKRSAVSDRVGLSQEAFNDRALKWREQIIEDTKGVLKPTISDVVNFKLENMSTQMTSSEIKAFRSKHFTWEKKLVWVKQKALGVAKSGRQPNMDQLWKEVEGGNTRSPRKPKTHTTTKKNDDQNNKNSGQKNEVFRGKLTTQIDK